MLFKFLRLYCIQVHIGACGLRILAEGLLQYVIVSKFCSWAAEGWWGEKESWACAPVSYLIWVMNVLLTYSTIMILDHWQEEVVKYLIKKTKKTKLWWPFELQTLHILCIVPTNWAKLTRTKKNDVRLNSQLP